MRDNRAAMSDTNKVQRENRLGEITWAFLRLGFVAFGGAVAHIAMMEEEVVRRRGCGERHQKAPGGKSARTWVT